MTCGQTEHWRRHSNYQPQRVNKLHLAIWNSSSILPCTLQSRGHCLGRLSYLYQKVFQIYQLLRQPAVMAAKHTFPHCYAGKLHGQFMKTPIISLHSTTTQMTLSQACLFPSLCLSWMTSWVCQISTTNHLVIISISVARPTSKTIVGHANSYQCITIPHNSWTGDTRNQIWNG